jgi:hypothetical protein
VPSARGRASKGSLRKSSRRRRGDAGDISFRIGLTPSRARPGHRLNQADGLGPSLPGRGQPAAQMESEGPLRNTLAGRAAGGAGHVAADRRRPWRSGSRVVGSRRIAAQRSPESTSLSSFTVHHGGGHSNGRLQGRQVGVSDVAVPERMCSAHRVTMTTHLGGHDADVGDPIDRPGAHDAPIYPPTMGRNAHLCALCLRLLRGRTSEYPALLRLMRTTLSGKKAKEVCHDTS